MYVAAMSSHNETPYSDYANMVAAASSTAHAAIWGTVGLSARNAAALGSIPLRGQPRNLRLRAAVLPVRRPWACFTSAYTLPILSELASARL
jgi:hypothetical protein